jgi:hypothetical protein
MNIRSLLGAGAVILAALLAWLLATDPGPADAGRGRDTASVPPVTDVPLSPTHPAGGEAASPPRTLAPWTPPKRPGGARSAPGRLPPPGTPFAGIVGDLLARARDGDAGAACRLAFELDRCFRLPSTRGFARRSRAFSREEAFDEGLRQRQASNAEYWEAIARRDEAACEGVDPREATGAWRYALQAAAAGHLPSMIRFASGRLMFDGNPPGRNLDGWIALRDHGPAWLAAGVEQGYAEAYETAHLAYARGEILGIAYPRDPVTGVALALALAKVGTAAERERSLANAAYVERREGLSAAQVERARALAVRLAARLLARAPAGSVDFTRGTFARDDGSHCEVPGP